MAGPLSITTDVLPLVGVVLNLSLTVIAMVDKTHGEAHDALRDLRRALQNLIKGISNIQKLLRILVSDPKNRAVEKLSALPGGALAVKKLCESLESTRGLLAKRARLARAFVRAIFKDRSSFSYIDYADATIALIDFQLEVKSCQQTTDLAFQHVWSLYNNQNLRRRSSASTTSEVSTQIPEASTATEPQATTTFRRETIDWLKGLVVTSKSNPETPNSVTQTGRGGRAGTGAEENTSAPERRAPEPPLTVVVTCPYEAQEDNEINLVEDEYIYNVERLDDGWWSGTTEDGKRGLFPASFVEKSAAPNKAGVSLPPRPVKA